jgi:hypothetical protein
VPRTFEEAAMPFAFIQIVEELIGGGEQHGLVSL